MLDRSGVQLCADPEEQRLALVAIVAQYTDLDELVCKQIDVDLVQYGGCDAVLTDDDERMERVRLGTKRATFRRS